MNQFNPNHSKKSNFSPSTAADQISLAVAHIAQARMLLLGIEPELTAEAQGKCIRLRSLISEVETLRSGVCQ